MGLDMSLQDIWGALKTATAKYVMIKEHKDLKYEKQKRLIDGEGGELSDDYMKLFNIELTSKGTGNNLGRAVVRKVFIRIKSHELVYIDDFDKLMCWRNL